MYSTVAHLRVKLWITKQTSIVHTIAAPQPALEHYVLFNCTAEPLVNIIYQAMACWYMLANPKKYCSTMDVAGSADYFELKQWHYTAERPMPIYQHSRLWYIPLIQCFWPSADILKPNKWIHNYLRVVGRIISAIVTLFEHCKAPWCSCSLAAWHTHTYLANSSS